MSLYLKKIASWFLEPLGASLVLLLGAFALRRHRRARIAAQSAAIAVLLLTSSPWVADALARPLEAGLVPYRPTTPSTAAPRHIVVLAGSYTANQDRALPDQLGNASLRRTLEGVELARRLPGALLWLSGGDPMGEGIAADGMAKFSIQQGIPARRLRLERGSRDTHDQAVALCRQFAGAPLVLVTSAYHMRRSIALFRRAGCRPIAAPTDFLTGPPAPARLRDALPDAEALGISTRALHEYVGMLWSRLRGQI